VLVFVRNLDEHRKPVTRVPEVLVRLKPIDNVGPSCANPWDAPLDNLMSKLDLGIRHIDTWKIDFGIFLLRIPVLGE
jgi:hypothetical protein